MEQKIKKDFIAFTCINLLVLASGDFLLKLEASQSDEEHSVHYHKHNYPLLSQFEHYATLS